MNTDELDVSLRPAHVQAAMIADGSITSRELLDHMIGRIETLDGDINAVVTTDFEAAKAAALKADEAVRAGGELGPLHGLPITVKDALETKGIVSTGGAIELADNVPVRDAPAVRAVKSAGAIVIAKTNLPRWSGDIQAFNELFGTTVNPWDPSRVPGGSSGGAAAAVATGMTAFEIGTDIGGSVRFPAAYCGVFGHKPSFGVIPTTGYLDHVDGGTTEADVNVVGPIARSAEDLDLLLTLMARKTPTWSAQLPAAALDLSGLRVAAWLDDEFCPVDSDVVTVLDRAVSALERSGVPVDRDARPDIDAARASSLGMFLVSAACTRPDDSDGVAHRTWGDWHVEREHIRLKWTEFFNDFDVVLMPVGFIPPFEHNQEGDWADRTLVCNGATRPYSDIIAWTLLIGMAYLPSTVPPIGLSVGGLPVGMQVVGPYGSDRTTIAMAGRISELCGGFQPPPIAIA